jgi:hypothetical protein
MSGNAVQPNGTEGRPRNWLVLVMLLSLRRRGNSYGYELMKWAAAFGFRTMNPGSMYRTLRQMENEGLCNSEWQTTSKCGPATPDVFSHGRWGGLPSLLGQGVGAVPADGGLFPPAVFQ